jgi:hypothetical protein
MITRATGKKGIFPVWTVRVLLSLHDYGDLSQWQRLVKDGEALLEQVAAQTLVVEIPNVFEFDNLNNALQFSKEDKRKAVVAVS